MISLLGADCARAVWPDLPGLATGHDGDWPFGAVADDASEDDLGQIVSALDLFDEV
jgi:hypothetical protein